MRTLDLFRPSVGASAVGMAQAALDVTISHVRERQAFGGPLARQQTVAHKIADMATDLDAARLLVYAAAAAYDGAAEPSLQSRRSAMAKLYATEAAQRIVDGCVQLHGARGLQRGHLLEHLYRDVRSLRIYEGASEIQRSIIARDLIGTGSHLMTIVLPVPRLGRADPQWQHFRFSSRGRRRHRHPGPAGQAERADLRELRRPARPDRGAAASPGCPGAGHPRRGTRVLRRR